ncbi:hypothetical protein [Limisphaera sp. VF-2]|jgi:hypothetical protein|uniref:hypothetical protein n=1 Tax=Limisphaera sp. VF-2 TaxID=3400418 RepID=UPI0017627BCD
MGAPRIQPELFGVPNLNAAAGANHPLRAIKRRVDVSLKERSPLLDKPDERKGRPCPRRATAEDPPVEPSRRRPNKASWCEPIDYNLLWLWVPDCVFSEGSSDPSSPAKSCHRVPSSDVAGLFSAKGHKPSHPTGQTRDDYSTVSSLLNESWASLKPFVRNDSAAAAKVQSARDEDAGNPSCPLCGESPGDAPLQSSTEPQGVPDCKARRLVARLRFGRHIVTDHCHGSFADLTIHDPLAGPEPGDGSAPRSGSSRTAGRAAALKTAGDGQDPYFVSLKVAFSPTSATRHKGHAP